jgi:translation initiation factor 2B subunit (eIF-2B alpha/beta/delta family)
MVVDSAAPFLISKESGRELMMDLVLIGCDTILPDGACFNKIGSFSIALSAHREKVPVYVAASLLKFSREWIPIEMRREKEIWPGAPKGLEILNFAFDLVPREFISGYITEFGIIKPEHIYRTVKQHYPWLFLSL